jgi:hypothetical protein
MHNKKTIIIMLSKKMKERRGININIKTNIEKKPYKNH